MASTVSTQSSFFCFVQSGRMASTLATNNFVFPVGDTSLLAILHVLLLLYVEKFKYIMFYFRG